MARTGSDGAQVALSVPATTIGRWGPLSVVVGGVLLVLGTCFIRSISANGGQFVYAQDDPYIHMAIARTLATTGVWGIQPGVFAPASSSPLWTVVLATLWAVGATSEFVPLILNLLAALLVLAAADATLKRRISSGHRRAWALAGLAFVLPLPTLVFVGMEHTFHVAAVIAVVAAATRHLERDEPIASSTALLAVCAVGLRYESAFVVAMLVALFAARGRPWSAGALAAAGVAPVALFAMYAVANGGPPIPIPLMLKSGATRFGSMSGVFSILGDWVHLLALHQRPVEAALAMAACLSALALAPRVTGFWSETILWLIVTLGVVVLHVLFIRVVWFYRYEAYLVGLGSVALAGAMAQADLVSIFGRRRKESNAIAWWAAVGCVVLLVLPLARRGAVALVTVPRAMHEIFLQQYQMGLFFSEHDIRGPLALNDIGAVSWLTKKPIVDLVGLATPEVADARRRNINDEAFYARVLSEHRVEVACVYEAYYPQPHFIPASWHKAGEWTITHTVAVGHEKVSFFAATKEARVRLTLALDNFARRLPRGVSYRAFSADRVERGMSNGPGHSGHLSGWLRRSGKDGPENPVPSQCRAYQVC